MAGEGIGGQGECASPGLSPSVDRHFAGRTSAVQTTANDGYQRRGFEIRELFELHRATEPIDHEIGPRAFDRSSDRG